QRDGYPRSEYRNRRAAHGTVVYHAASEVDQLGLRRRTRRGSPVARAVGPVLATALAHPGSAAEGAVDDRPRFHPCATRRGHDGVRRRMGARGGWVEAVAEVSGGASAWTSATHPVGG